MPVGLQPPGDLCEIAGIRLSALHCGIKSDKSIEDLVLVEINESARVAAVFTTNRFCAAPVVVARQHLNDNSNPRYLLINSGNANAGTGNSGYEAAITSCEQVARHVQIPANAVLPFSTGVIAAPLPVDKISAAIPALVSDLSGDGWLKAAKGIMTTDILPKAISTKVTLANGQSVSITGIAKGSGMIKPDMATMLSFVATDAEIAPQLLQRILLEATEVSFNAITVDGDTSTNDACVLIATGESGAVIGADNQEFKPALIDLFQKLAQSIIRDGEGATKFVEIEVLQADSVADAREVGFTIAHSPLVKTALFASDPNWGRILAAIGRAKVEQMELDQVDLYLGEVCLLKNGLPDSGYREELGQKEMDCEEIKITVMLGQGNSGATIWTTDLSYDYVKINAEYRS